VFFTTDLHGSDDCFRKLITAATMYEADVLVVGGDITGKMVVPIVERADGSWRCTFLDREHNFGSVAEVERMEKLITRSGSYPYRTGEAELKRIGQDHARVEELAKELAVERVRHWIRLAEERLADSGVRVFMSGGNDDVYEIDDVLDGSSLVVNHNNKVVALDEHHEMVGLGYANPTPWRCPRDIPEEDLEVRIEELVGQLKNVENSVFCFHVPPLDSHLDTCPRLDDKVYPPRVMTDATGRPLLHGAGSRAVREAIERYQPLLGLHGHIHESRGVTQIGRTLALNPGSEYSEGILRGAILNLTSEGILSYQLTSG
jgi:Icc-related predicted phosphoesterase